MVWTKSRAGITVLAAMAEHRSQIGERIRVLRAQRGLSQSELAHAAGVDVKTISRVENGRHELRRNTIRGVARALGVAETDLIGAPPAPLGLGAPAEGNDRLDQIEATLREIADRLERIEQALTPAPSPETRLSDPETRRLIRDAFERVADEVRAGSLELAQDR